MTSYSCVASTVFKPHRSKLSVLCDARASHKKVKVRLSLPYETKFGQSLCLTGGVKELGSWKEEACVDMAWHQGNIWKTECELPRGTEIEYKYILKQGDGSMEWQPGSNITLELPNDSQGESLVHVMDSWLDGNQEVSIKGHHISVGSKEETTRPMELEMVPNEVGEIVGTGIVDIGAPEDSPSSWESNSRSIGSMDGDEKDVLSNTETNPSTASMGPFAEQI